MSCHWTQGLVSLSVRQQHAVLGALSCKRSNGDHSKR
jgi:hypothetical protein